MKMSNDCREIFYPVKIKDKGRYIVSTSAETEKQKAGVCI